MIEVYKIVTNKYQSTVSPVLRLNSNRNTRGNKYKLISHSFHYDVRKYSFTPRVVNIWNSLPDRVVDANSVDVFKKRLDEFWCNQAVRFDWKATLTGTGNRSEISLDNSLYCIFEMDN